MSFRPVEFASSLCARTGEMLKIMITSILWKPNGVATGKAMSPVTLGRSSIGAVEILGGLQAKDLVIVGSSNGLRDGSRVEARTPNVAAR